MYNDGSNALKVIAPATVTMANVVSSAPYQVPEWAAGTYTTGQQVYVIGDLRVFEVTAAPSTTENPVDSVAAQTGAWAVVNTVNPMRMFDNYLANPTVGTGPLSVTISDVGVITDIAIYDIQCLSFNVQMTTPGDGVVFDKNYDVQDITGINNLYQFFFAPVTFKDRFHISGLPAYGDCSLTLTFFDVAVAGPEGDPGVMISDAYVVPIFPSGGTQVQVGEVVVGQSKSFGLVTEDSEFGFDSYGVQYTDAFGIVRTIDRDEYERVSYRVRLPRADAGWVNALLKSRISKPTTFIGSSELDVFTVHGFVQTPIRIVADHHTYFDAKIDVIGVA